MKQNVPPVRIRTLNEAPVARGQYVLYWMVANRRAGWNFSLQRAVEWCAELNAPLLILEPLRCGYQWASDRFHRFVLDGMADNARAFASTSARYYPYVEPKLNAGQGLIRSVCQNACVVVTDDFPCFFLPKMLVAAAAKIPVRMEAVDSNGLFPIHATPRVFTVAHSFRRFLQKEIRPHLAEFPKADPLRGVKLPTAADLPIEVLQRWPAADLATLTKGDSLAKLPIDHSVSVTSQRGGTEAAGSKLREFVQHRVIRYEERNHPDVVAASGLSPYLHFGHLSAHEVFQAVMGTVAWHVDAIALQPNGKTHGWWNATPPIESFLDELITWREIGFNMSSHRHDYDEYTSLPDWALQTLQEHAADQRAFVYDLKAFEEAATHDPLWNAAQNQLREEGIIQNYLRMLWGKKILEWTASPQVALANMIELNNKYALDGRDPNSYSGIFWVLGRYDRAWPERPVYGKIRSMSSDNTRRKVRLEKYLQRFGNAGAGRQAF